MEIPGIRAEELFGAEAVSLDKEVCVMKCKYIKPIMDETCIVRFQEIIGVKFDESYVDFILKNNGGRPEKNLILLGDGAEYILNKFLSFNETDKENIYKAKKRVEEDDVSLIPFASDPAGDYFCFLSGRIYLYDHETGGAKEIADSFTDFLEMLRE